jgi:hypothetical protein
MPLYVTTPELVALQQKFSELCSKLSPERLSDITFSAACIFQGHSVGQEALGKCLTSEWNGPFEQEYFDTTLAMFRLHKELNPQIHEENEDAGEE